MLFQMSGLGRRNNLSEQKYLEQSRNISVANINLIHLIQIRTYKSLNDIPQYREYMNNCEWPINTNDCLFFAKKQSLLLRTSTRSPTYKTMHVTPA